MRTTPLFRGLAGHRSPLRQAFSLVESLVVMAVVSLLLALVAPSFVALAPSRKTGIHEVAGFLENARARALAEGVEMAVAFAGRDFPREETALRAYALFTLDRRQGDWRRLTPWRTLPPGLVFARGEHFEVEGGIAFRTLHDLSEAQAFPLGVGTESGEAAVSLPCVVFGPDGGVREPAFADADALHLGLVEGFLEPGSRRLVLASKGGAGTRGDCLGIGYYTGRARLLTD